MNFGATMLDNYFMSDNQIFLMFDKPKNYKNTLTEFILQ